MGKGLYDLYVLYWSIRWGQDGNSVDRSGMSSRPSRTVSCIICHKLRKKENDKSELQI